MSMSKFKERRKYPRYPAIEQLTVRFNDTFFNGTECSDISYGGMCIVVDDRIGKEVKYGIVFLVQKYKEEVIFFESKFMKMWDNLVYVDRNDTRIGVKFLDIDDNNLKSLSRIISLQEKQKKRHHN